MSLPTSSNANATIEVNCGKVGVRVWAGMRVAAFLTCLVGMVSCGYVKAGRWEDDRENWDRAFGRVVPAGWRVVHSEYWRNAHFTYEGGYYFQIRVPSAERRLLMHSDLIRLKPEQVEMEGACSPRPSWFAPKGAEAYETWGSPQGTGNYQLFIEPTGPDVFVMDCQH